MQHSTFIFCIGMRFLFATHSSDGSPQLPIYNIYLVVDYSGVQYRILTYMDSTVSSKLTQLLIIVTAELVRWKHFIYTVHVIHRLPA